MDELDEHIHLLESRINALNKEIDNTNSELTKAREQRKNQSKKFQRIIEDVQPQVRRAGQSPSENDKEEPRKGWNWPLKRDEYLRYGRQLILPGIGLEGQLLLKKARVLVVGIGGLGSPAIAYLAGAGIGTVGLVDGDVVEMSNLPRQILHTTDRVGMSKAVSAVEFAKSLNPDTQYHAHTSHIVPETAADLIAKYDVVLDCTDHPAIRYLISDICVLLQKTLVSASALQTDGQLLTLNNPPAKPGDSSGGPCYRCIFPSPPPPETVVSCGDGGILGPVVGVMGALQALEAIKLIVSAKSTSMEDKLLQTEKGSPSDPNDRPPHDIQSISKGSYQYMVLFSAQPEITFRTVRLRGRKPDCLVCSSQALINLKSIRSGSYNYSQFCRESEKSEELKPSERISVDRLAQQLKRQSIFEKAHINSDLQIKPYMKRSEESGSTSIANNEKQMEQFIVVDVRRKVQYDVAHLPNSINIPFSLIEASKYERPLGLEGAIINTINTPDWVKTLIDLPKSSPIYVVCRLGNDSQMVVRRLKQLGLDNNGNRYIGDVRGGVRKWAEKFGNEGEGFPDF